MAGGSCGRPGTGSSTSVTNTESELQDFGHTHSLGHRERTELQFVAVVGQYAYQEFRQFVGGSGASR